MVEEPPPWREVRERENSRILTQSETMRFHGFCLMRKRTPRVGGLQAAAGRQHMGLLQGVAFVRSVTLGELLNHYVPWFPCL